MIAERKLINFSRMLLVVGKIIRGPLLNLNPEVRSKLDRFYYEIKENPK
jgi:hypothetical protein